jgi:hypothetical protein
MGNARQTTRRRLRISDKPGFGSIDVINLKGG